MAFDPVTLLTMSAVVLLALGVLMLKVACGPAQAGVVRSRGPAGPEAVRRLLAHGARVFAPRPGAGDARACSLLRRSGAAFLCLGVGFILLLLSPKDVHTPLRVLGNAAMTIAFGLLWSASRRFDRRTAPFEAVTAGALLWLLVAWLFDPSQGARIALLSAIEAAYSLAIAFEHRRDGEDLPSRRFAAWVFGAHGAFFALRALTGSALGLGPAGPDIAQSWGALLGVEAVMAAVAVAFASIGMSRERTARQHRREALEDPLTEVGNRRALQRSGGALLDACRDAGHPASLILMDLDGFKRVNDLHGHPAGDRLLVAFARLAHAYLPPTSLVCRIGGEEFAALLPGADLSRARAVADELRALFAHVALEGPAGTLRTTVSAGVAAADGGDVAGLLARADRCLYAAKHGGRDRVVAEGDPLAAAGEAGRRTAA